jgi:hypothetical protein
VIDVRIDGTNHTGLAVLSLGAVEPDGLGIGNANSVREELGRVASSRGSRHETREESIGLVRHHVLDRDAGVVKVGLGDRVVLCLISSCVQQNEDVYAPWGETGTGPYLRERL